MSEPRPRVVIAEDDPGLAKVLSFQFDRSGFDPVIARNGEIAWELYQRQHPSAIVSDYEMPRMTGLELCRAIRNVDSTIPFFLVTGRQLELIGTGIEQELNIQHVFGKPFSPAAVIDAVRMATRRIERDGEHARSDSRSPGQTTAVHPIASLKHASFLPLVTK